MNRLVIIGNGFELAHGLKTSYNDFIDWYWGQRINRLSLLHAKEDGDLLCKLSIKDNKDFSDWFNFFFLFNLSLTRCVLNMTDLLVIAIAPSYIS